MDRRSEGFFGNERFGIGDCWFYVVDSFIGVGFWFCYLVFFGGYVIVVGFGVVESFVVVWIFKRFFFVVYSDMFF